MKTIIPILKQIRIKKLIAETEHDLRVCNFNISLQKENISVLSKLSMLFPEIPIIELKAGIVAMSVDKGDGKGFQPVGEVKTMSMLFKPIASDMGTIDKDIFEKLSNMGLTEEESLKRNKEKAFNFGEMYGMSKFKQDNMDAIPFPNLPNCRSTIAEVQNCMTCKYGNPLLLIKRCRKCFDANKGYTNWEKKKC